MTRIAFFTGTRADYGLLVSSARELSSNPDISVGFVVAGNHYVREFGYTCEDIIDDGFEVWASVDELENTNSAEDITSYIACMMLKLQDESFLSSIDGLIILGDRYEAFAAAQVAYFHRVPIIHIHAGERTDGAQDDFVRHCISQLASFHICSTESYLLRCLQLGIEPSRVSVLGSPAQDNILNAPKVERNEFTATFGMDKNRPFFLITIHPETQNPRLTCQLIPELMRALESYSIYQVLITYPNSDEGSQVIIDQINEWKELDPSRVFVVKSLGLARYLQAVSHSALVIGNSSSGLIEAPTLGIPTVDIGSRQKGRECAKSVLHCGAQSDQIKSCIKDALNLKNSNDNSFYLNPYGGPGFSVRFKKWFENEFQKKVANNPTRVFFDLPKRLLKCAVTCEQ